jgi:hypothetical protein
MSDSEQLSDEEKARRGEEIVDAELTGADDAFTRVELRGTLDPEAVDDEREVAEGDEDGLVLGGGADE